MASDINHFDDNC